MWLLVALAVIGVVAVIGGAALWASRDHGEPPLRRDAATLSPEALHARLTASGAFTTDQEADPGSGHVNDINLRYHVNPPAGGDHYQEAAPAGDYGKVQPPDAVLVHSMEHGYVVIWYQPSLSNAEMGQVRRVYRTFRHDVLLVARADMPYRVAATAWHQRLLGSRVEAQPLADFVAAYANKGPEKVPHT